MKPPFKENLRPLSGTVCLLSWVWKWSLLSGRAWMHLLSRRAWCVRWIVSHMRVCWVFDWWCFWFGLCRSVLRISGRNFAGLDWWGIVDVSCFWGLLVMQWICLEYFQDDGVTQWQGWMMVCCLAEDDIHRPPVSERSRGSYPSDTT